MILLKISNSSEVVKAKAGRLFEKITPDRIDEKLVESQVIQTMIEQLKIEGILVTMYDTRLNLSKQVVSELEDYFKDKVYNTYIHRNVRLGEAPSHGKPILLYDATSTGAQNYMNLVTEFLDRNDW